MSDTKRPTIKPAPNGPFLVEGLPTLTRMADGKTFELEAKAALCRCGGSANKPFCDGTHSRNGFTSKKSDDRVPDRLESYEAEGIVVHDNRGVCAHAGRCTDGLPEVFRLRKEPFVDAEAAPVQSIEDTIRSCPSGALSYTKDGELHREFGGEPSAGFAPNGPYVFRGGADLEAELGEGATTDHFTLCRCGASTNKPFCSGAHWNVKFDEDAGDGA